jgi:hypothetical protein
VGGKEEEAGRSRKKRGRAAEAEAELTRPAAAEAGARANIIRMGIIMGRVGGSVMCIFVKLTTCISIIVIFCKYLCDWPFRYKEEQEQHF